MASGKKKASGKSRAPSTSLGDIARVKVLGSHGTGEGNANIGHPFFFPGERVERQETAVGRVDSFAGAQPETIYVTVTAMPPSGLFVGGSGRILLSYDAAALVAYGGVFFTTSPNGRRCVQSVYLIESARRTDLAKLLTRLVRDKGIPCTFLPASPAGRSWSERSGLSLVEWGARSRRRRSPSPFARSRSAR